MCVCVVAVGGFSHQRGFSQIKDLDCEILDYATERHIRGSFLPSFESSGVFGQCQQALIPDMGKEEKKNKTRKKQRKAALCLVNFENEWTNQSLEAWKQF